jgi:hypothetical protein
MNPNENKIMELFPTPLYVNNIKEPLINQQKDYLLGLPKISNTGNLRSESGWIFEYPLFIELKKTIQQNINEYIQIVYPGSNTEVYMTQSWANYTEPGQHHHIHTHPNSFISGIFYVNAVAGEDQVTFFKTERPAFNIVYNEPNNYNTGQISVLVETGDLLLFPSNFQHAVQPTTSKETRISVSFNTFIKGNIGSDMESTALYLK